jgi:putative aminopeptidase FrvX
MSTIRHRRLLRLLSQPTAPFRESHVAAHVAATLERKGVPHFEDPAGNLVVGAASAAAYRRMLRSRDGEPLRLFIAHMDHPGFHGVRWLAPDRLAVRWHGGSPVRHLAGTRMRLVTDEGVIGSGRLLRPVIREGGWAIDKAEIRLDAPLQPQPKATAIYGGFEFRAPVWESADRIYCPAADDLVGVHAIVETALHLWSGARGGNAPFIGLLTRADEADFLGALAHLELGWLQERRRQVLAISLEASRTLPGAEIGKGPVVRLGDRRTVFDPAMLEAMSQAARRALPERHQRRVMDGGSCEATAMTAWGVPAAGISVPLGNYHNQGLDGGDDFRASGGPAPEFVSRDDADAMVKLCVALASPASCWSDPWAMQRARLRRNLARSKKLLARQN